MASKFLSNLLTVMFGYNCCDDAEQTPQSDQLRIASYSLFVLHMRCLLTCLWVIYLRSHSNPNLIQLLSHSAGVLPIMSDAAVKPLHVSMVALLLSSLAVNWLTRRELRNPSPTTRHTIISLATIVNRLVFTHHISKLVPRSIITALSGSALVVAIYVTTDYLFHPPDLSSRYEMIAFCVTRLGTALSVISFLAIVTQWFFIISLLVLTVSQLGKMLERIERCFDIIFEILRMTNQEIMTPDLQEKLNRIVVQFASLCELLTASRVALYWSRVVFIFVLCYLTQSTNFLFSGIFLQSNSIISVLQYVIVLPFSLLTIVISLMMCHFNMRFKAAHCQIECCIASTVARVKISPYLRLRICRLLETSSSVRFKCGVIDKPFDGALLLAVLIKQARNFLLLIKSHYL